MKQIAQLELTRFKALADMLDTVEPKQFTLDEWMKTAPQERKTFLFGLIETDPGCGFAGCAMGWAAYRAIFPNFIVMNNGAIRYEVNDKKYTAWDAVRMVLGIDPNHRGIASYLFGMDSYKVRATPQMVAARIRRFVAKIEAIRARDRRRNASDKKPQLTIVA